MSWRYRLRSNSATKSQRSVCKVLDEYHAAIKDAFWMCYGFGYDVGSYGRLLRSAGPLWKPDGRWTKTVKWANKFDEQYRAFRKLCQELKGFKGWYKLLGGTLAKKEDEVERCWFKVLDKADGFCLLPCADKANFDDRLAGVESFAECLQSATTVFRTFSNAWLEWDESDYRTGFKNCSKCTRTHRFRSDVTYEKAKKEVQEHYTATARYYPDGDDYLPRIGMC